MVTVLENLETLLEGKDTDDLGVDVLLNCFEPMREYTVLSDGIFFPKLAMDPNMPTPHKDKVRAFVKAVVGGNEHWHECGPTLTRPQHPDAVKYGEAYLTVVRTRPGQVATVALDGQRYYVGMFPQNEPSQRVAIFVSSG